MEGNGPARSGLGSLSTSWQFTISLIVAILVFGGGTMAAMVAGREVPNALWAIDGALGNAILGSAGFFTQRAMHRDSLAHQAQAMEYSTGIVTAMSPGTTATTTPGEPSK